MFKTISENEIQAEIVEKKSKFIANIFYVETTEDAEEKIKQIKKKYFDARHNCFAYSIVTKNGIVSRFSDDGEPSGTAGAPMLNILNSNNLSNVLVVVTRYFGGILLGTGGLVRAYTEAVQVALARSSILQKELGFEVQINVMYQDLENMKYYLKQKNIEISEIEYEEEIKVRIDISEEEYKELLNNSRFKVLYSEVIKEKYIKIHEKQ